MLVTWAGLKLLNYLLARWAAPTRRFLRRGLKKYGVQLLPTRRRRIGGTSKIVDDEIISLNETQRVRLRRVLRNFGPWITRLLGVSLTLGVVYFVVQPVVAEWPAVRDRLGRLDPVRLLLGIVLYAAVLLLFRAAAWQRLVRRPARPVAVRVAARIWSLGHLMRHLPGRSHVVLRMELARPHGVAAGQTLAALSTELRIGVLAAGLVATIAAAWRASHLLPSLTPLWIAAAVGTCVAILVGVGPKWFYRLTPNAMPRHSSGTPLTASQLLRPFVWLAVGAVAQATVVWLLVGDLLVPDGDARFQTYVAVVAAWSLGRVGASLATWAPAGIGVREGLFVLVLATLLPYAVDEAMQKSFEQAAFHNLASANEDEQSNAISRVVAVFDPAGLRDVRWAYLFFLAILLRLATTAAELLLAVAATAADWRSLVRFLQGGVGPTQVVDQSTSKPTM